MSSRVVRFLVLIATVAAILPWHATPAVAFTETSDNNFFGTGAGSDPNNTGHANSFFGASAGNKNTTGRDNSFFGLGAGLLNTTGSKNAFFGNLAGGTNTEADGNSMFGSAAGLVNSACCNAFFGSDAGRDNTTGIANVFLGANAGALNTEGASNVNVGEGAGPSNTTGSRNVFLGRFTGESNTTESDNTFLGAVSNGAAGITNATAIGAGARVSQSDSLVLGSIAGVGGGVADVRVGIGTDTPASALHVRRSSGAAKVFVEEASTTLAGRALFELANNGATRFRIRNTANNATWDFQSSSGAGSFVIDRVGGPASLDFEIKPNGDAVHAGSVTATGFITSSDRNLKTDITPAKASKLMSLLRQLDISTWRFKDQAKGTINLGPMAQDFHRLFAMGSETTIDVRDLAALALVAAQVQDAEVTGLKKDARAKDSRIASLERDVAALKALDRG